MRVIAGSSGGISLSVPGKVARPTADRVREAIFSSLGDLVPGAAVLDLFAGSGSLGIEALSRGAASCLFVEEDAAACRTIRENLARTGLAERGAAVWQGSVESWLGRLTASETGSFDLVLADPPYARDEETAARLASLLADASLPEAVSSDAVMVLETWTKSPLPPSPIWTVTREAVYGDTRVSYHIRA